MIGCCGAGLLNSSLALAQDTGTAALAATRLDDATPRDYNIAPGPLGAALGSFTSQSGLLVSYDPELTRGRTAPALKGRYTVSEGIQRLLANAGLQLVPSSTGSYVLIAQRAAPNAAAELSPTMVEAAAQGPEADTYRAPRSSVHLNSEQIDRFGRVSAGDLLNGLPGVQVGDTRNGGALDVNIRGIQGQSRVAVKVVVRSRPWTSIAVMAAPSNAATSTPT